MFTQSWIAGAIRSGSPNVWHRREQTDKPARFCLLAAISRLDTVKEIHENSAARTGERSQRATIAGRKLPAMMAGPRNRMYSAA
jgi:hypothetical protein